MGSNAVSATHYWNYRLVVDRDGKIAIREVFYDKTDDHIVMMSDPIVVETSHDVEALKREYKMMQEAFRKPLIRLEEIRKRFGL